MSYLNTSNLPAQHILEAVIQDPVNVKETHFIITNTKDIIFLTKYPPLPIYGVEQEPGFSLVQAEFPLSSLYWVIDLLENKFWKPFSQGGLSNSVLHVKNLVCGEMLLLRSTFNCGGEGEKGYTLNNYSRLPFRGSDNHQSFQMPNRLLRDAGLLDLFKNILIKYQVPLPEVKEAPPPDWSKKS